MKIMFVITPYRSYLKQLYRNNLGLEKKSYDVQKGFIDEDCFAWCGVWDIPFQKLGFETMSVYPNCKPLQTKWVKEFGKVKNYDINLTLKDQINFFKPDILMIDNIITYNDKWILELKNNFHFIKKIIGYICSPDYNPKKIKNYDFILTCLESIKIKIKKYNKNTFIVPLAFNTRILEKVEKKTNYLNKIIFYGGILRGEGMHSYREKLLNFLVHNNLKIDMYSEAYNFNNFKAVTYFLIKKSICLLISFAIKAPFIKSLVINSSFYDRMILWQNLKWRYFNNNLKNNLKRPLYGIKLFDKLSTYIAALNVHGDIVGSEAANLRLFEAAGMGCCLLTDYKINNNKFFNSNEILEYSNPHECLKKIEWIYNNKEEAKSIGRKAQKRVLKDHTYHNRAKLILQIIKNG